MDGDAVDVVPTRRLQRPSSASRHGWSVLNHPCLDGDAGRGYRGPGRGYRGSTEVRAGMPADRAGITADRAGMCGQVGSTIKARVRPIARIGFSSLRWTPRSVITCR